jgi:hypothetical protein
LQAEKQEQEIHDLFKTETELWAEPCSPEDMLTTYIRKYIEKDESPQDSDGSICILDDIQKPVVYLEINKENIQND